MHAQRFLHCASCIMHHPHVQLNGNATLLLRFACLTFDFADSVMHDANGELNGRATFFLRYACSTLL